MNILIVDDQPPFSDTQACMLRADGFAPTATRRAARRWPGRILSRPQIMECVWQDGGESLERTIDTHIEPLLAVRDEEVVLTHRGLGYRISAG